VQIITLSAGGPIGARIIRVERPLTGIQTAHADIFYIDHQYFLLAVTKAVSLKISNHIKDQSSEELL
jgi:hypothetical protein